MACIVATGSRMPLRLQIGWAFTPVDRDLPEASAQALAAIGPAGARSAIEYVYFTSAQLNGHTDRVYHPGE